MIQEGEVQQLPRALTFCLECLNSEGRYNKRAKAEVYGHPEAKTILKAKQHCERRNEHPRYNRADRYYLFIQTGAVFGFRTGHNRL